MKDETCGVPEKGFAELKSKMYAFLTENNHGSKKSRGINKIIVDEKLKYKDWKNVSFNKSYMRQERKWIELKTNNIM